MKNTRRADDMNDLTSELVHFQALWRERSVPPIAHSPAIWDERADEWIREQNGQEVDGRVDWTACLLRAHGLLSASDAVVDVGCGAGLFVAEFAKTAKHATGMDFSQRFLDYAAQYSETRGIKNVSFTQCDFLTFDVEKAGLSGAFDLVFTSITPAASGEGCLEKLMKMSRAYCYNASFVHSSDELAARVSRDVFREEYSPRFNGRGFYALVNLLFLSGYYPEITYYNEVHDNIAEPTPALAAECARNLTHESAEDKARILLYLQSLGGAIPHHSETRFGSILWDVRQRDNRA
jgi:SAM-dependent methyltransferase